MKGEEMTGRVGRMDGMGDLAEFLLARIAEDEDAARRAAFGYGAEWTSMSDDAEDWSVVHADGQRDMVGCEDGDVTRHIARHDPARVLAECDAKRRIVALYLGAVSARARMSDPIKQLLGDCMVETHLDTLRVLALPYADHPDFRSEWRA